MTVYWVIWDAGAHWVVDRLERQGALPHVRRLRRRGAMAAARPSRPNCQTPPALATLLTGTWPHEHAITGFTVPGASGSGATSQRNGFAPGILAVPPVWEQLVEDRALRAAFVHTPWVFDADGHLGHHVEGAIEAYSNRHARHGTLTIPPGGTHQWAIGEHPLTIDARHSGVRIRTAAGGTQWLRPNGPWRALNLAGHDAGVWMGCVRDTEGLRLTHSGLWAPRAAGTNLGLVTRLRRCPPFAGEGVGRLYRGGMFGPRLAEGGDGTAEGVLLSSLRCVARSFAAATHAVLQEHHADLAVIYLPMTDDIGHELLGWCDEQSNAYRPDIAGQAWKYIATCYRWSDDILGAVLDRAGPDDTVVLSADHGMAGVTHLVHVNDVLVSAALAATTPDGRLDLERSDVIYHPADNGSLWASASGGGPRAHQLLGRAMSTLSHLRCPVTARPVVAGFLDEQGRAMSDPREVRHPVAYLMLSEDYQPSALLTGSGPVIVPVAKTGAHVVNTGSGRLNAIYLAAGPGISPGSAPAVIDNTEPAHLVRRQLLSRLPEGGSRWPPHPTTPTPRRKRHWPPVAPSTSRLSSPPVASTPSGSQPP